MARGPEGRHVLGLDVGAVSLSAVETEPDGTPLRSFYELHRGDLPGTVEKILRELDLSSIDALAATSSTPSLLRADARFDDT